MRVVKSPVRVYDTPVDVEIPGGVRCWRLLCRLGMKEKQSAWNALAKQELLEGKRRRNAERHTNELLFMARMTWSN